jgi:hypothetical protein
MFLAASTGLTSVEQQSLEGDRVQQLISVGDVTLGERFL